MLYFLAYLFTWLVSHAMFLRHHYKVLVIIDTDCIYVVVHTIMTTTTPVYHAVYIAKSYSIQLLTFNEVYS